MSSPTRGRTDEPRRRGPPPSAIELLSNSGNHPREARIRHRREFVRIQKRGIRVHTPSFTVVALPGRETTRARLGCAVSKRVGNAVTRNRVRRLIKEMFRRLASRLPIVDFVVIAKPRARALAAEGWIPFVEDLAPALIAAGKRAQRRSR